MNCKTVSIFVLKLFTVSIYRKGRNKMETRFHDILDDVSSEIPGF